MKGDFHVHTTHTDGSDTPEEVFQMAKNNGVTHLSITDHDTLYGIDGHHRLGAQYGIHYIPGIEISAYDYQRQIPCHIIGLYVNKGYGPLEDMIEKITFERHANSRSQVETLIKLGYNISLEDFKEVTGIHGFYKQHIMDVLIQKGYADNLHGDFYKKMFKNGGPLERYINYPNHTDAVKVLAQMGAIPILAHPTLYGNLESLPELVHNGLLGIEINYPSIDMSYRPVIRHLAKNYGLQLSGGSDYHGRYGDHSIGSVGSHYVETFTLR